MLTDDQEIARLEMKIVQFERTVTAYRRWVKRLRVENTMLETETKTQRSEIIVLKDEAERRLGILRDAEVFC